jgi:hypothetical protein
MPDISSHPIFIDKELIFFDKPDNLPKSAKFNNPEYKLILVDDFIGSGETALNALSYVMRDIGIDQSNIIILSIVAQIEGIEKIQAQKVTICTAEVRKKGITDSFTSPQKEDYIKIMKEVEDHLIFEENHHKYHFGYNRSEALVSLIRTPNNTFPIFWLEPEINGVKLVAPFPRL